MAKAEIFSGGCGFSTTVVTSKNGRQVDVSIQSECSAIQKLGEALTRVEPFQEISFRRNTPLTLQMGAQYCTHAACLVPVGIIKAVEVEAGLALPVDACIRFSE